MGSLAPEIWTHFTKVPINLAKNRMVEGFAIDQSSMPSITCEACIQAKQSRKPYPKIDQHSWGKDVWGPTRIESIGKWRWYISFIDDCTWNGDIKFMKTKGEAFDWIKEQVAKIEQKFGKAPRWIRIDNGEEFVNEEMKKWVAKKGITIETTAPYLPSQNGIAERLNRTLLEMARAMIIAKGLPKFLWDEAVAHANYLCIRSPT